MRDDIETSFTGRARTGRRPNILFITCDQWRGDCLSAVGHPVVQTPNTDALAREGTLFRRHYAGAAPCSPARACIYTGRYQMTNRVCRNGSPMDSRFGNIALAARSLGYDPTLFGYTDVAPDPRRHAPGDPVLTSYEGVLPGFTVRQLLPEHQKPWISWLRARGIDAPAFPAVHRPVGAPSEVSNAPPLYGRDATPAAFIAGEFVRWLSEQDAGRPWFAHLSFISPHPPYVVPAPFNTMYDPADGPAFQRASSFKAERATHPWLGDHLARQKKGKFVVGASGKVKDWGDAEFRILRALYYGMISEVDDQLGRVWSALQAAGCWNDTAIVLTSDHAEMMGDHFMLGKGGYFDGSYHVPLVVRAPGLPAGGRVGSFTEAVDIAPTLIELMGGTPAAWLDGHSLLPLAHGPIQGWRDCAHWEFDFRALTKREGRLGLDPRQSNLAVIRSERAKYVHFGGSLPPLLFDLQADPGELNDVADDPDYRHVRLEFAERLLSWRAEHLDQRLALVELGDEGPVGPAWR